MKADVAVIRKNASNDDDDDADDNDDEKLLEKERLCRYKLLINVDEMKHDIINGNNHEQAPLLEQCQCFDIFSTVSPFDPMEIMMKRRSIDRIILYAAEHDLRPSKFVISIVHASIDTFFDFILVTNRRSRDEWNRLRDDALQWGEHFFQQYRDAVDRIGDEANRRLPQRFREKRKDIENRAMADCETRGIEWNDKIDHTMSSITSRLYGSRFRVATFTGLRKFFRSMKSINRDYLSEEQKFIDMVVEREVTKPVILDIISQESSHIKQSANENFTCHRSKNELLHAAYREMWIEIGNFGDIHHLTVGQTVLKVLRGLLLSSGFLIDSIIFTPPLLVIYMLRKRRSDEAAQDAFDRRKNGILHYLVDLEGVLSTMGDHLKQNLIEWITNEQKKFVNKVNGYHRVVCRTIEDRHRAYELARSYAPNFARIECRLEANLNLATHHGSRPVIDRQEVLGTGGFFTVHPASWDTEHRLVAKILRDHGINQDLAYLEAHFHRTVSNLNILHVTPLKYLYEENDSSLYLLLPRYPTDLHSFLVTHMGQVTADKAIKISHDIAIAIAHMHAYDLVHRDIKVQNILIDEQEQVYLADFGTCQHGTENITFVGSRPVAPEITTTPSSTAVSSSSDRQYSYQGTTVDVYLLGMIMYACAPKDIYIPPSDITFDQLHLLDRRRVPQRYCQLIGRCLNRDSKQRPTAKEIVDELDAMAEQLCLICQEAPRIARCEPCGHKTMCVVCLTQIQQRSAQPKCIICKQVFTSVREDDDTNTFFATASNSA
ncbi:unnamed protein product [Didymodactylos carnosus]|uniref:Uncharacterized protein n=2 Tax=Didymodactylos carnosus TaxID=1234261 RepID=A0A814MA29_9BILA|nr:unnamed protein product [Didymodactylos carnosus]CAF3842887.1 unnamed protein product [Didymodactylos carnosus]